MSENDEGSAEHGPTMAVLVRTSGPVLFGSGVLAVHSVHPNRETAARTLADRILAGDAESFGWRVVEVPADGFLVQQPVQLQQHADRLSALVDQHGADLAAALGLNEARPWGDMCREVRAQRHRLDLFESGEITPPGGWVSATNLDPEGLERAARLVAGGPAQNTPMSEGEWASYNGGSQERAMRIAEHVVRAYLSDADADG